MVFRKSFIYGVKGWIAQIYHHVFPVSNGQLICLRPFNHLIMGNTGLEVCCYQNLNMPFDQLRKVDFYEHNPALVELRKSVLNGSYQYCPESCPVLASGREQKKKYFRKMVVDYGGIKGKKRDYLPVLKKPLLSHLSMAMEDACNFTCPSCRHEKRLNKLSSEQLQVGWNYFNSLLPSLKGIVLGGNGEPLLVPEVRDFLVNSKQRGLSSLEEITIITNGSLLTTKFWENISPDIIPKLELVVSIDGCSSAVYDVNRRGGDFVSLMKNLEYTSTLPIGKLIFSMVVQENNFKQIISLVRLARRMGASAHFLALRDWGTFSSDELQKRQIANSSHPRHFEYIEVLRHQELNGCDVNISELLGALS